MIVLDAAALLDALLDQPGQAGVLDQLAGQEVCAPAHQPAEVLSTVALAGRDHPAGGALRADRSRRPGAVAPMSLTGA